MAVVQRGNQVRPAEEDAVRRSGAEEKGQLADSGAGKEVASGSDSDGDVHETVVERPVIPKCKIVIDPGHGTPDPGAVGPTKLQEQEVNLKVALRLAELLKDSYDVVLTRRDYRGAMPSVRGSLTEKVSYTKKASLRYRAGLSKQVEAAMFVSVHANAAANDQAHGYEVFHNDSGRWLARSVFAAMGRAMPDHRPRRVEMAKYFVLRKNTVPAILVELEFISNAEQEAWLKKSDTLTLLARAIHEGIIEAKF